MAADDFGGSFVYLACNLEPHSNKLLLIPSFCELG